MEELGPKSLSDCISRLLSQVNHFVRGKIPDKTKALSDVRASLNLISTGVDEYNNPDKEMTEQLTEKGIVLFNRTRQLQVPGDPVLLAIQGYIKACAVYLLLLQKDASLNENITTIRALSKAGIYLQEESGDYEASVKLLAKAHEKWNEVDLFRLSKALPELECEDFLLSVFQMFIHEIGGLSKTDNRNGPKIIHVIKDCVKLTKLVGGTHSKLVEMTISLSETLYKKKEYAEAISFLQTGLDSFEFPPAPQKGRRNEAADIYKRLLFGLAYCYSHTEQHEQSITCLSQIVDGGYLSNEEDKASILYAKCNVFLQAGDYEGAKVSLKELISTSKYFDLALTATRKFAVTLEYNPKSLEFYQDLARHYPEDPQFTDIRLNLLKSLMALIKLKNETHHDDSNFTQAQNICKALSEDHWNGQHKLSSTQEAAFKDLLISIVGYYRSNSNWEICHRWCAVLLSSKFLQQEKEKEACICSIQAESFCNCKNYPQAQEAAQKAVDLDSSIRSTRILFWTHIMDPNGTVEKCLKSLETLSDSSRYSPQEMLDFLMVCVLMCSEATNFVVTQTLQMTLLEKWLHTYINNGVMIDVRRDACNGDINTSTKSEPNAETDEVKYFSVLRYLITVLVQDSEESKDECDEEKSEIVWQTPKQEHLTKLMELITKSVDLIKKAANSKDETMEDESQDNHFEKFSSRIKALGCTKDIYELASISWNLAISCSKLLTEAAVQKAHVFYSLSFELYRFCQLGGIQTSSNQMTCLIMAVSSILENESGSVPAYKLKECMEKISLARNLMTSFKDRQPEKAAKASTLLLLMDFIIICRLKDGDILLYVQQRQSEFLKCSTDMIQFCAETSKKEECDPKICAELYQICMQKCVQAQPTDSELLGKLYRQILLHASSKQKALSICEEFHQLLQDGSYRFEKEDVDFVCAKCYNLGLSLWELEQFTFSEKFIGLSLSMMKHTSEEMTKQWQKDIQDTYTKVLEDASADNNTGGISIS